MNILEITNNYNFDDLDLEAPSALTGGSYFTKLINKNNYKSVYLQLPKCTTKQGVVKNNNKIYVDLMFNSSELPLLRWLEEFEQYCQKKIFDKKELWFHNDITFNDIQEMMNPLTRLFKSGKYTIMRSQIKNNKIKIYDENESSLDLENLKVDDFIIPLIHLNGIKFTSNNFTIDINLVQLMIVSPDEELNKCIINIKQKKNSKIDLEKNISSIYKNESKDIKNNNNISLEVLDKDLKHNKELEEIKESETNNELEVTKDSEEKNELELEVIEEGNQAENNLNELEVTKESDQNNELEENNELDNDKIYLKDIKFPNETNLQEVNLDEINEEEEKIDIKDAELVYYEIYKAARKKAKQIKKTAIEAYLEAKKIKNQYMLHDFDESSDSEMEELSNI